jgi:hypothetical protein
MADNLPPLSADVTESGSLNLPEPSGPHRPVMGLLYLFFYLPCFMHKTLGVVYCPVKNRVLMKWVSHKNQQCKHRFKSYNCLFPLQNDTNIPQTVASVADLRAADVTGCGGGDRFSLRSTSFSPWDRNLLARHRLLGTDFYTWHGISRSYRGNTAYF